MAKTFYLSSITSDLSGGTLFNRYYDDGPSSANSLNVSVANSSTQTAYGFMLQNGLNGFSWNGDGNTHTVEVNVTTASSAISLTISLSRISSTGTVLQTSATTASQSLGTTGVKTFTVSQAWTSPAATDRIRVNYNFTSTNAHGGNASVTIETGTTNTEFTVPAVRNTPTVTTQAVTSILDVSATGNGTVSSQGAAAITERGLVWNTAGSPTTANSKVVVSGTTGSFSGSLTGLSAVTTYYVRAYAINSFGTSYGNQVSFTTSSGPNPAPLLSQQKADLTYLATGGQQATGSKTYFDMDITGGTQGQSVTIYGEAEKVGTAFDNVSNISTELGSANAYFGSNNPPTVFRSHNLVYDSIRKRFIQLFGWNGTTNTNEVFEFRVDPKASPSKPTWRPLPASGSYPTARRLAGAAFDPVNNRVVVFGGYTTTDTNELFQLSFASSADGQWSTLSATGTAPSVRSNIQTSTVYNPNDGCIYIVGGWGAAVYKDIYRLDVNNATASWTLMNNSGPLSVRRDCVADIDVPRNRLIIHSGQNGTGANNDCWAYNITGNTFTNLTPGFDTGARYLHIGWVNPVTNKFIVAYGTHDGTVGGLQRSWWSYDLAGSGGWTSMNPTSNMELPNPVWGASMAYDSANKIMAFNGGIDQTNDMQRSVYFIDANDTAADVTVYGASQNTYKKAQDAAACVINHQDGEVLSIGGLGNMQDDTTISSGEHMADVFVAKIEDSSTVNWKIATKGLFSLHNREGAMAAWDSTRKRALVFGGLRGVTGTFNDLWELKRSSDGQYTAKKLKPTGSRPPQRWLGVAGYDSVNDRFIIYGGEDGDSTLRSDTWACSFSGSDQGAWSQVTPSGTAPTPAWGFAYCQDWDSNVLYVYGGSTSASDANYSTQFLSLNLSTLTWTTLTNPNSAVRSATLAYRSGNIYKFGGWNGTAVQFGQFTYNIASATWSANLGGSASGVARRSHISWASPSYLYIAEGRPATGTWFTTDFRRDLTATSTGPDWVATTTQRHLRYRSFYTPASDGDYHWQAWYDINGTASYKGSYGGNVESAIDFIIGVSGGGGTDGYVKVRLGGAFQTKPIKVKISGSFVQKTHKHKSGGSWTIT